jgi:hypothetical protein
MNLPIVHLSVLLIAVNIIMAVIALVPASISVGNLVWTVKSYSRYYNPLQT